MAAPDDFVTAYVTAMLWSSSDTDSDGNEHESLESFDLSAEAEAQARKDCDAFWALASQFISEDACTNARKECTAIEYAGHDFWLTRVGHGCGFWDGDWREPEATKLTELAKGFGERWPYLGDDGLVYVSA